MNQLVKIKLNMKNESQLYIILQMDNESMSVDNINLI